MYPCTLKNATPENQTDRKHDKSYPPRPAGCKNNLGLRDTKINPKLDLKTLLRFPDRAKTFRDPSFSRYNSTTLLFMQIKEDHPPRLKTSLLFTQVNLWVGKHWGFRETKFTVSSGTRHQVILLYSWRFWNWKFIKPLCNGGRWSIRPLTLDFAIERLLFTFTASGKRQTQVKNFSE